MSAKQGISKWHRKDSINKVAKCIVQMYITAELKAYWLPCSYYAQQWLRLLQSHQYMCICVC